MTQLSLFDTQPKLEPFGIGIICGTCPRKRKGEVCGGTVRRNADFDGYRRQTVTRKGITEPEHGAYTCNDCGFEWWNTHDAELLDNPIMFPLWLWPLGTNSKDFER